MRPITTIRGLFGRNGEEAGDLRDVEVNKEGAVEKEEFFLATLGISGEFPMVKS